MVRKVDRYSILEVEQFVGISRTKIRHYMDKNLINVQRDDQSGYYSYTFEDLMRICQIAYYRENLGFSIDKAEQLLKTTDGREFEAIIRDQMQYLKREIAVRDQQYKTVVFNCKLLDRQNRHKDHITLIPFDAAYIVPYNYYLIPYHKVYPILYGASEFAFVNGEIKHVRRCCLAFEQDAEFVSKDAFDSFRVEGERVEVGLCIYTVTLTTKNPHDPSLLQPVIDWAHEHSFRIKGRIFVTHFFPYYDEGTTYMYVESYLPIDL
ncbi:MAG TPA: hypothetical protein DEB24_05205 [Coriobacteriia bacterium]|nr:hypothetical protein [Coriobacteriia bacterium]